MSIQAYDIQLGPAGSNTSTQTIEATAQICDFLSSGSAFDQIEVRPDFTAGSAVLKLGQGFDFGKPVNRWLVVNRTATAVNGSLMLSTAGFRNFRISGDVNVLDGGKSRTLTNTAFSLFGNVLNGVASQYSRVQLWNPAASGKRLVVETLTVLSGNASESMALVFNQTQLATLWGAGISKRSSGAVSTAGLIYTDTTVTAPPTTAEGIVFQMSALTNQQYAYKEPVIVDPGYGLVVWGVNQNIGLGCTFEWYEEPNT